MILNPTDVIVSLLFILAYELLCYHFHVHLIYFAFFLSGFHLCQQKAKQKKRNIKPSACEQPLLSLCRNKNSTSWECLFYFALSRFVLYLLLFAAEDVCDVSNSDGDAG